MTTTDFFWTTLPERIENNIIPEPMSGCWLWTGCDAGRRYGKIGYGGYEELAHRLIYCLLVKPIPQGLVIDHKCKNTWCVNPEHLEAVTQKENVRRGDAGKYQSIRMLCPKGHAYDEQNTYMNKNGSRACRACGLLRTWKRRGKLHDEHRFDAS